MDYRKYDVNMSVIIHHKGGYWNCAIRVIRILESLTAGGVLLRTVSLSSCLLFTLMKQHLDMYTYKVGTQQRRRCLATFDIAIHNRYKVRRYLLGLSSHISIPYTVQFYFNVGTMILQPRLQISQNRKLNVIMWWICSAIIHVFTKTPPTQGH